MKKRYTIGDLAAMAEVAIITAKQEGRKPEKVLLGPEEWRSFMMGETPELSVTALGMNGCPTFFGLPVSPMDSQGVAVKCSKYSEVITETGTFETD